MPSLFFNRAHPMYKLIELATSPAYWTLWFVARLVGHTCFRIRFQGLDWLPDKGGLLIAANHASVLDIPFLGCGVKRRLAFIGRHNLFPIPVLHSLLQHLGWIPINQHRGDRAAFRRAEQLLLKGKAVVIFPEGARTITGKIGDGKPGLGRLVARTGCPVLPVYIDGTFEALPIGSLWPTLGPVTVVYGKPIDFSSERGKLTRRDFYRHVARTVMHNIQILSRGKEPATLLADRMIHRAPSQ
jgi:1-acyl-sn-glycerol-3-phosphate acyltransferase